jgi:hypothetical protein
LRVHALRYPGQRRGRPGGRTAVQSASLLWEPWPRSWSARAGMGEYAARRSGRRVRPATRPPRWLWGCGLSRGPEASDPFATPLFSAPCRWRCLGVPCLAA